MQNIDQIKQFLAEYKLKEALKLILNTTRNNHPDLYNQAIMQSGRLSDLYAQILAGVISIDDERRENAKIIRALLELTDGLTKIIVNENNETSEQIGQILQKELSFLDFPYDSASFSYGKYKSLEILLNSFNSLNKSDILNVFQTLKGLDFEQLALAFIRLVEQNENLYVFDSLLYACNTEIENKTFHGIMSDKQEIIEMALQYLPKPLNIDITYLLLQTPAFLIRLSKSATLITSDFGISNSIFLLIAPT